VRFRILTAGIALVVVAGLLVGAGIEKSDLPSAIKELQETLQQVRVELKNLRASIASVKELTGAAKAENGSPLLRSTSTSGAAPGWERALDAYRHGIQSEKMTLYHPAILDYSDAIELDPHNDSAFLHRAYCYYQLAEYENALLDLNRSLAIQPHNSWAYAVRASVYAAQGRNDLALKDADEAVARDPKRAESYLLRGDLYRQAGATQNAIDDYTSAITLLPRVEKPYLARAAILLSMGQTQRALQDCNRAIDLNSNTAGAFLCRAECYLRTGDAALAIQDINRAKLAPENSGPMKELLTTAEELLDYGGKPGSKTEPQRASQPPKIPQSDAQNPAQSAAETKSGARPEAPDLSTQVANRPVPVVSREASKGSTVSSVGPAADSSSSPAPKRAAVVHVAAVEHRDAPANISGAVSSGTASSPGTANSPKAGASTQLTAVSTASPAGQPGSDAAKARQLEKAGRQLAAQGKLEDALGTLIQAVESDPNLATARNARGYVYMRLGQMEQAIADFSEAIRLNPEYPNAYLNRGAARALTGDRSGATSDMRKAEQLGARPAQARNDDPSQNLAVSRATKAP
jgi:tetratricopeptide (TPR) repeat protein